MRTAVLVALVVWACSSTSAPHGAKSAIQLSIVSGNLQVGVVDSALDSLLVVRVTTTSGQPVPGEAVAWTVTSGLGALRALVDTTDASGLASNKWTIGYTDSLPQVLTAQIVGATDSSGTVTFRARPRPGIPDTVVMVSGNNQSGEIGRPLADSLVVQLYDRWGNPSPGDVVWQGTGDGDSLGYSDSAGSYAISSSTGVAKAQWTLNMVAGPQGPVSTCLVRYQKPEYCVQFTATATIAGSPGLTKVSGDGQTFLAGLTMPNELLVQVKDADGTLLDNVPVTFHVSPASGALGESPFIQLRYFILGTDSVETISSTKGLAGTYWVPGIGSSTLTVTSPGAAPLTFTATGLAFSGTAVSSGLSNCGIATSGGTYCWGASVPGQNANSFALSPVAISGVPAFQQLFGGQQSMCGVTAAGVASCWGYSVPLASCTANGLTCPNYVLTPPSTISSPPVAQIAQGGGVTQGSEMAHRCLLTTSGVALCYGQNEYGQVGDSMPTAGDTVVTTPTPVAGQHTFSALTAGTAHTCGVTTTGAVYCWGADSTGQLGDGSPARTQTSPVLVAGLSAVAIAAGALHTCAIATSGTTYCWGSNDSGQVGDGTNTNRSTPVAVAGGIRFTAIAAGGNYTCALTAQGAAYCWGGVPYYYQKSPTIVTVPTAVGNTVPLATISTDGVNICGLTVGGSAVCWGQSYTVGDAIDYSPSAEEWWFTQPVAVAPPGYALPTGYLENQVASVARKFAPTRTRSAPAVRSNRSVRPKTRSSITRD
ncbi:MAG TPA: hypothetical protein VK733_03655 [Gemmatimonadaceae bacterium]|jgi:hypothetical protein|nr:hypothetical protein [Gemmatimonadaceae bacterium]